nr:immunoglobulin heavy chain junction region [Macaca mulatta]MOV50840.1 immunoglobulin heavy chain junction region [Macaca mulatta]MOV50854.1 immunoglobulin heavy chain junction region [Macaca mulatta]
CASLFILGVLPYNSLDVW